MQNFASLSKISKIEYILKKKTKRIKRKCKIKLLILKKIQQLKNEWNMDDKYSNL